MRNAARITREQYDYYMERLLGPVPTYEAPLPDPVADNVVSNTPTPLNPVTNDNSTASGSGTSPSTLIIENIN
jgi:hypothetical protein